MNIKSLLLGSAAALAVVSGAQAADAIVAAEPEPAEYVKVCDAFGTGYFYIPGTETCLNIGGWVRFQTDVVKDAADDYAYNAWGKAYLSFDARSESEFGTVQGFIAIEGDYTGRTTTLSGDGNAIYVDEAFLAVGGFKAGYFYHYLDAGLNGETDKLGDNTEFVSVQYNYTGEGFTAGLGLDELGTDAGDLNGVGVSGQLGASLGGISATLVGYYDTSASEGGVRAILGAEVGPGTFQLGGLYNSGINNYFDNGTEWAVAASYAIKATDALTVTPGVQYTEYDTGADDWKAGVTVDYALTQGLTTKTSIQYSDSTEDVTGFFRIQRSF